MPDREMQMLACATLLTQALGVAIPASSVVWCSMRDRGQSLAELQSVGSLLRLTRLTHQGTPLEYCLPQDSSAFQSAQLLLAAFSCSCRDAMIRGSL